MTWWNSLPSLFALEWGELVMIPPLELMKDEFLLSYSSFSKIPLLSQGVQLLVKKVFCFLVGKNAAGSSGLFQVRL